MSDLIERVAKAANWPVTFDEDDLSSPYVAVGNDWIYVEKGELTPAGLVFLLCELLDAGWELRKEGDEELAPFMMERLEQPSRFADRNSLEEAVMEAFLLHKGER